MMASHGRLALAVFSYIAPPSDTSTFQSPPAVDRTGRTGSPQAVAMDLLSGFGIPQAAINGTPSLIRYQDPPPDLYKRDCLANGTNYCFNNNVNYCANCGTCCGTTSDPWCCASDAICCGSACCAGGQTCSDGQCYLPV